MATKKYLAYKEDLDNHVVDLYNHHPVVAATSEDGVAYTATVEGLTELFVGLRLTIIPNRVSAAKTPTLNINGLGAKNIIMPIGGVNSSITTNAAELPTWVGANMPMEIRYDGTRFKSEITANSAQYLYGNVGVNGGGTGASTAEEARENLGVVDPADVFSEEATYAVGDYCIHGNVLYKCTTAVTTAGAWNASNWTATTVEAELSGLNSNKANKTDPTLTWNLNPGTDNEATIELREAGNSPTKSLSIVRTDKNGNKVFTTLVNYDGTCKLTNLGATTTASLNADLTLTSGTWGKILDLSLPAGTYIVNALIRFNKNSTGSRALNINETSGASVIHANTNAHATGVTAMNLTRIITLTTAGHIYINGYQNSGSSLAVSKDITSAKAVRIA